MTSADWISGESIPLSDAQLGELGELAGRLADAAGAAILPHFRATLAVDNKLGDNGFDPVTLADRAAEAAIRGLLAATRPQDAIFGEEQGYRPGSSGLTWVIDPIDGTRAFITGMPLWGTLIALHDGLRPVLGVMDQPYIGERFCGSRLGATLRRGGVSRPLHTRGCGGLSQAALQCTALDMFKPGAERTAYDALADTVRLRRYSGDCYAYCMLAHGLLDLVVEAELKPYDIQALIPIVEAAGGRISDWRGGDAQLGGQVLAAGDAALHARALEVLAAGADRI